MNGVEGLYRTNLGYLRAVVDDVDGKSYMGLNLIAFVARLEAYHETFGARLDTRK